MVSTRGTMGWSPSSVRPVFDRVPSVRTSCGFAIACRTCRRRTWSCRRSSTRPWRPPRPSTLGVGLRLASSPLPSERRRRPVALASSPHFAAAVPWRRRPQHRLSPRRRRRVGRIPGGPRACNRVGIAGLDVARFSAAASASSAAVPAAVEASPAAVEAAAGPVLIGSRISGAVPVAQSRQSYRWRFSAIFRELVHLVAAWPRAVCIKPVEAGSVVVDLKQIVHLALLWPRVTVKRQDRRDRRC